VLTSFKTNEDIAAVPTKYFPVNTRSITT
jgi:hypothetical protein